MYFNSDIAQFAFVFCFTPKQLCHGFLQKRHEGNQGELLLVLTGAIKRYLPAAVRGSRPGAVVDGPGLHDARLGGVCLGSPHQDADPTQEGRGESKEHARGACAGERMLMPGSLQSTAASSAPASTEMNVGGKSSFS